MLAALNGEVTLLASVPLMLEYEAVMTREEHCVAAGLTSAEVSAILDAVAAVAEPVHVSFLWRPRLRDPDDEMILEAAVNGQADCIVTFNIRHLQGVSAEFGVRVIATKEAWDLIRGGRG